MDIMGAVISNALGFIFIVIMNIVTIRIKTNTRIKVFATLVKPVLCGISTYFIISYIKFNHHFTMLKIILLIVLMFVVYLFMLIITKTVTINLEKPLNKRLNLA